MQATQLGVLTTLVCLLCGCTSLTNKDTNQVPALLPDETGPTASAEQFQPGSQGIESTPSSDFTAPSAAAEKSKVYESDAVKADPTLKSGSNGKGWAVPANPQRSEPVDSSTPSSLPKSDALPDLGIVEAETESSLSGTIGETEKIVTDRVSSTGTTFNNKVDLERAPAVLGPPSFSNGASKSVDSFSSIPLSSGKNFGDPVPGGGVTDSLNSSKNTVTSSASTIIEDPFSPIVSSSNTNQEQSLKSTFPELGPPQLAAPSAPSLPQSPSIPSTPSASSGGLVRGGQPAPLFTVNTMDGTSFDLSNHKGKVVVLDFWRKTCAPCVKAMPKLAELRNSYPEDKLVVLGMNTDETRNEAESFLRQHPHKWRNVHCLSQRTNTMASYGIRLLPTFIVIDQVGNIQYQGHEIGVASLKVSELVSNPSIPNANYMAALR